MEKKTEVRRKLVASALLIGILSFTTLSQVFASGPTSTITKQDWINQENNVAPPTGIGCFTMAYPDTTWQAVPCGQPPTGAEAAIPTIGGASGDQSDSSSYLLGSSLGTFTSESGYNSEYDSGTGCFPANAWDWYSLQVNTGKWSTTYGGQSVTAWEQFVFQNVGCPLYNHAYIYVGCPT